MRIAELSLLSEPYSPSGNMAASGVKRLLGAPRLDLLQTLVREAVQNCCDAAKLGSGPKVKFRLRRLDAMQLEALKSSFFNQLPAHPETADPISDFLSDANPWILEICDFNTTGLGGPTRADIPPAEGEHADFVNFIRDIGIRRDTELGGGTYGFGKSALYLASCCGLIIVDSETVCNGSQVRRLIAQQMGESYVADVEGIARRFTGRHWWGRMNEAEAFVEPLEGAEAVQLARAIGFPDREPGEAGTSIMILAPQFIEENELDAVGAIQEALLWNFWPRMMADVPSSRYLDVAIELEGVQHPVPRPEDVAPLDLFCDAMRSVRNGEPSVTAVQIAQRSPILGHLAIAKGFRGDRIPLRTSSETLFPGTSHHIAVMRPVELVVRYFDDGDPLPQAGFEWAGVFVVSSDPEVEQAFADAEPPAHDDWQPDMLPKRSKAKRYVTGALGRIKDAARGVSGGSQIPTTGSRDGPSLGHIADMFGRALGSANLQGAASSDARPAGGRSNPGRRSTSSISRPSFLRLDEIAGRAVALFSASVRNDSSSSLDLDLQPALVLDGGGTADDVAEHRRPRVVGVLFDEQMLPGDGTRYHLGTRSGDVVMAVTIPDDGAVTISARIAEESGT